MRILLRFTAPLSLIRATIAAFPPMPAARRTTFTHDVITVGSAVVDQYLRSPAFEIQPKAGAPDGFEACVPLGLKIGLSDLIFESGGGATNAATTFSRLGFKAAAACRVGSGLHGDFVVRRLKEEGVDASLVQRDPDAHTGQSIILVAGAGFRSILVHRGASADLNAKQIPWSRLRPRWFYVTSLGGDLGLMSLLLDRAEQVGARVAWNPGQAEMEKGLSRLTPLIKRVDVLNMNREEAALLTHKAPRHLSSITRMLADLPKVALLITDGNNGAYLTSRDCTWFSPAMPGKRTNTTGAGDALGSGFVAGFLQSCDLATALKVGMLNALNVITHMGAKTGILKKWPTARDLERVKIRSMRVSSL